MLDELQNDDSGNGQNQTIEIMRAMQSEFRHETNKLNGRISKQNILIWFLIGYIAYTKWTAYGFR